MVDIQTIIITTSGSVAAGLFFMRLWVNGVNTRIREIEVKLESKVGEAMCCERRKNQKEDIDDLFKRMREQEMGR